MGRRRDDEGSNRSWKTADWGPHLVVVADIGIPEAEAQQVARFMQSWKDRCTGGLILVEWTTATVWADPVKLVRAIDNWEQQAPGLARSIEGWGNSDWEASARFLPELTGARSGPVGPSSPSSEALLRAATAGRPDPWDPGTRISPPHPGDRISGTLVKNGVTLYTVTPAEREEPRDAVGPGLPDRPRRVYERHRLDPSDTSRSVRLIVPPVETRDAAKDQIHPTTLLIHRGVPHAVFEVDTAPSSASKVPPSGKKRLTTKGG